MSSPGDRDRGDVAEETSDTNPGRLKRPSVCELASKFRDTSTDHQGKRDRSESGDPAPAGKRGAIDRESDPGSSPAQFSRRWKEYLENALDDLQHRIMASISRDISEFNENVLAKLSAMDERLHDLERHVEKRDGVIEALNSELRETRDEVKKLSERAESAEMNSRIPCLILSGRALAPRHARLGAPLPPPSDRPAPQGTAAGHATPAGSADPPSPGASSRGGAARERRAAGGRDEAQQEDIYSLVIDVVRARLRGLDIREEDIDRAHRLPGPNNRVIVRFVRSGPNSVRDQLMSRRLELRHHNDLFINESLTSQKNDIYRSLLQAKKDKRIYTVFTRGIPHSEACGLSVARVRSSVSSSLAWLAAAGSGSALLAASPVSELSVVAPALLLPAAARAAVLPAAAPFPARVAASVPAALTVCFIAAVSTEICPHSSSMSSHISLQYRVKEETTTCPFNRSHQLTPKRYHLHIVRCAKQTTGRDVKICAFNAKHIIDIPKYAHHIEHCKDREKLDRVICEKAEQMREALKDRAEPVETAPGFQFSGAEESWDDETSLPRHQRRVSYNPREAIANRDVFRFPQEPMGKSSRRQFRSDTVALLRQIQAGEPTGSEASSATAASASTGPRRRPAVPRLPNTTTLALAAHPRLGRGQRVAPVPAPVGLSVDMPVVTALHRLTIGRGRGRTTQVASPGPAATTAAM